MRCKLLFQNLILVGEVSLSILVVGCSGGGTSTPVDQQLSHTSVMAVSSDSKGNIFAGTTGNGSVKPCGQVYTVSKTVNSWTSLSGSVPDCSKIISLDIDTNDSIYVGTEGLGLSNAGSVYVTTKDNKSWAVVGGESIPDGGIAHSVIVRNENVYVGSTGAGRRSSGHVYVSDHATSPWKVVGGGVDLGSATRVHALAVSADGAVYAGVNSMYAGASAGGKVYMAATPSSTWKAISGEMPNKQLVLALASDSNNNIYAGTGSRHHIGGKVYVSSNASEWAPVAAEIPDGGSINKIIVDAANNIYVASGHGDVYVKTAGSAKWDIVGGSKIADDLPVYSIQVSANGDVIAGSKNGLVYSSKHGQERWVKVGEGLDLLEKQSSN